MVMAMATMHQEIMRMISTVYGKSSMAGLLGYNDTERYGQIQSMLSRLILLSGMTPIWMAMAIMPAEMIRICAPLLLEHPAWIDSAVQILT